MDQKQIAKQMIDFNKAAFDNSFNAMAILQDQIEKMASTALEQNNMIPAEGKRQSLPGLRTTKKAAMILKQQPMKVLRRSKLSSLSSNCFMHAALDKLLSFHIIKPLKKNNGKLW
ncbi:MAG: hypothetical protein MZV70_51175 [Desulfobacterales bacterium]|nr:hypothetical protein [Desulfobacterales bacterium]